MFFAENIPIILIISVVSALIAFYVHFFKVSVSQNTVKIFSAINNIIGLIFATVLSYSFIFIRDFESYETAINWLTSGDLSVSLGILVDKTSSVFFFVFMLISFIIQCVSLKFYKDNKSFNLFFGYFNLLIFSMTALIFSSNFVQSVIFSCVIGICAYLLLNLNFDKINVSKQAHKYLSFDRIGDVLFIVAIIVLFYFTKTYELFSDVEFLSYSRLPEIIADIYVYMTDNTFFILCSVIFVGIAVKSSIFPFHSKLLASVSDYSPVSYIIYTISTLSGLFFIIRLMPVFSITPEILNVVMGILIISGLYCDLFSLFQVNIQKKEAYCFAFLSALLCVFPLAKVVNPEVQHIFVIFAVFILFLFLIEILSSFVLENNSNIQNEKVKSFMKHFEVDGDYTDKFIDFCADNLFESPKNLLKVIDKYVINTIAKIPAYISKMLSAIVTHIQNGNIQTYIICAIIFIAFLFVFYFIILAGISGV